MGRVFVFTFLIFVKLGLNAQFAFIDDQGWENNKFITFKPDSSLALRKTPEIYKDKDTVLIQYLYPNNKIAIEGKAVVVDGSYLWKIGQWRIFYKNNKLWCLKSYNNKGGLISIDTLLSPKGVSLQKGYGRKASLMFAQTGHVYIYNENGVVSDIARYNGGKIIEKIDPGRYSENQLKRVVIREFENENGSWQEYSLEEALEIQEENKKPILLQISNGFNGFTHKGYKNLYPAKEVNDLLSQNFICAYLDLNDSKQIKFRKSGKEAIYEGATMSSKVHQAAKVYLNSISGTPYFVFIEDGKAVYNYYGIELQKEKFVAILEFYLSGRFRTEDWKTFKDSLNK